MNTYEKKLIKTITIPEGVREIKISKFEDKVTIEFVPEVKKFKVGDKVKVRKGFPYEGRVLTIREVAATSEHQHYPYSVEELDYMFFSENALDYYGSRIKAGIIQLHDQ